MVPDVIDEERPRAGSDSSVVSRGQGSSELLSTNELEHTIAITQSGSPILDSKGGMTRGKAGNIGVLMTYIQTYEIERMKVVSLEEKVRDANSVIENHEAKLSLLEAEITQTNRLLEEKDRRIKDLTINLNSEKSVVSQREATLAETGQKVVALQDEMELSKAKLDSATTECIRQEADLEMMRRQATSLKSDNESLRLKFEKVHAEIKIKESDLIAAAETQKVLQARADELEEQARKDKFSILELRNSLDQQNSQLENQSHRSTPISDTKSEAGGIKDSSIGKRQRSSAISASGVQYTKLRPRGGPSTATGPSTTKQASSVASSKGKPTVAERNTGTSMTTKKLKQVAKKP
ncbi:hypothetical protein DENSPDRAFT_885089 [Dentipellis sp. KUC8613]|nr:hypothetical protein DENSPDRAFT_885089 [Dentipellis sp. KUC8613]